MTKTPKNIICLGDRPYKRYLKGPCILSARIPKDSIGHIDQICIAGPNDLIDTKGIKPRKNYFVRF